MPMTEAEVIRLTREHLEGQFPKVCAVCTRSYGNFREYLLNTTPVGSTISYDAELNDWNPVQPLGTMECANCPCGNTLSLSSEGLPLRRLWQLMNSSRNAKARPDVRGLVEIPARGNSQTSRGSLRSGKHFRNQGIIITLPQFKSSGTA
jgi:hypothetical protein